MNGLLITFVALGAGTWLVAWLVHLEVRRVERKDARLRTLHPSTFRDTIEPSPGEHVRIVRPPYDWQAWEDDCGDR